MRLPYCQGEKLPLLKDSSSTRCQVISLYQDTQATQLLANERFRAEWATLSAACPWCTCFQEAPFVTTWYYCYSDQFRPLILTGENDGCLTGLFTLAIDRSNNALCVAGSYHAEYHVWLARPEEGSQFIQEALQILRKSFPRGALRLLFVPPKTPVEWTKTSASRYSLIPLSRPLMLTHPADAARESLRKKSNKSKLNRLEKEGPVSFSRVTSVKEICSLMDEISYLCDFRQGAAHGVLPFLSDTHKKAFYIAMMEYPGLLHVTVLRVGGCLAAAHIGQCNGSEVLLGILTHSPFFAQHSVGKLHLLFLALHMEQDGFQALDLTPGGEYKDRFASHSDQAYILQIFFSRTAASVHRAKRALIRFVKPLVRPEWRTQVLRLAPHFARPQTLPGKLWRLAKRFCYQRREYRLYRRAVGAAASPQPLECMRCDHIPDLLLYTPAESWQPSTRAFLREAAERLEQGQHVYTHVTDGQLVHYGWMIERQQHACITEVGQKIEMALDSAVLYDFYTHPAYRGRGLYQQSLAQMTHDAAAVPGTRYIYIGALRDNAASCHVIEKTGFQLQATLYQLRLLGRVKRW